MPNPTLLTLADTRYVYACIHDRSVRGGCGYYDSTGHYVPLSGLGWLRTHSADVHDLFVSTYTYKSLAVGGGMPYGRASYPNFECLLAARLTNGRVYVTTYADQTVLHEWLCRGDQWRGHPVHWDCVTYVIDSRDYRRLMWERRKRLERTRSNDRTGV